MCFFFLLFFLWRGTVGFSLVAPWSITILGKVSSGGSHGVIIKADILGEPQAQEVK